jgi:putative two-component system response regulator
MSGVDLTSASILIIDDEEGIVRLLERLLRRHGYTRIHGTTDPEDGLQFFSSGVVDLVLLDLSMPRMDGFQVLQRMKSMTAEDDYVPFLMLTGNTQREVRNQALASGARDFLAKPFDPDEALLRIRNLLDTRRLQRALALHNETLEARVRDRTRELEAAQLEILTRLALIAEYYDDDTADHTRRVSWLTERIARELDVPAADATLMGRAALLHDVGKIAVPASLTRKPGQLSSSERDQMERHAAVGAHLLAGSPLPLLRLAEEIARSHHERWDGLGYPNALRGEEVPLSGRIVAVADVYDALTSVRPYKGAWTPARALDEVRDGAGNQFDPRVVAALERVLSRETRDGVPPPRTSAAAAAASDAYCRP